MPTRIGADDIAGRLADTGHAYVLALRVWPGEGVVGSAHSEVSISGPNANARQDVHRHGKPVVEAYVPIGGGIRFAYRQARGPDRRWRLGDCPPGAAVVFDWREVHYVQYDGPCVVVKTPPTGQRLDKQVYADELQLARQAMAGTQAERRKGTE